MLRFNSLVVCIGSAFMLLGAVHVQGQGLPPDGTHYSKALILFEDATSYEVRDLRIEGDLVTFRRSDASSRSSLPLDEVTDIRWWKGRPAALYGLGFAAGNGAIAALIILSVNEDDTDAFEGEISYAPWVLGSAAVGGIVGYLVMRRLGEWKGTAYDQNSRVQVAPLLLPSQVGLSVRLTLPIP